MKINKYKALLLGLFTVILMTLLVACYGTEVMLTVPKDFTKIEGMNNLYYVPAQNNLVYYINYSWSGQQGYGVMNEWLCGENDKPYHYDANTNTLYTLED